MRKFKRILSLLLSVIVLIPLITVSPMAQTAEVTYSASASENDTLAPENAFDGDPTTRWASDEGLVSGENYKWLQASYTTPQTINQVVIDWERANVNAYDIQVKTGDGEWITIYESTEQHESLLHTIDLGAAIVFTDLKVVIKDFFAKAVDRKGDEVDWPTVSIVELSLNHNVEETPVEPEIPSDPVDNATEPEVEAPVVDATTIYVGQQDENLALNKVVTGSDLETNTQFTKEKIVDGKKGPSKPLATYYASNENDKPIQITIDLGQLTEVESAIIFWERTVENQNITAFKLSGSADNATYTELYSQNTLVDVMNQYINFEVQNIQFLRLDITEFDGGALQWVNVGIDEIEVYSHPVSEPVEAYVGAMGENLALNVPVTGTAHEPGTQFVKENMVDGNKSTRYSSDQNVKPITFTFDLRKLTLLENVVIEWEREANAQNIIAFTLEGSIDNETLVDEPTGLTATFLSTAFDSLPELVVEVTGEHAYDLSFKIDGLSVQPKLTVKVRIPLNGLNPFDVEVYHINGEVHQRIEKITIVENKTMVEFDAESFSVYYLKGTAQQQPPVVQHEPPVTQPEPEKPNSELPNSGSNDLRVLSIFGLTMVASGLMLLTKKKKEV